MIRYKTQNHFAVNLAPFFISGFDLQSYTNSSFLGWKLAPPPYILYISLTCIALTENWSESSFCFYCNSSYPHRLWKAP